MARKGLVCADIHVNFEQFEWLLRTFSVPVLRIQHIVKNKKKISHRQLGPLRGSSSPFQHFEPARVKPNSSPPDNGLGQYVSSPGNRAYCYAELAIR